MSPVKMSKYEEAMRVALAFYEAVNRQDIEGMMALVSEDCAFDSDRPWDIEDNNGKMAIREYWEEFFKNEPAQKIEIEEIYNMGDKCVFRWKFKKNPEEGGYKYRKGADIFNVKDKMITEMYYFVKKEK